MIEFCGLVAITGVVMFVIGIIGDMKGAINGK
jgi:preprotein translocase subunit Sss1